MKIYNISLEFLSPVHIGSGEEIDPLNYVVKNDYFYKINLEKFIYELEKENKNKFLSMIDNNNLDKLRNFILKNCDLDRYTYYKARISRRFKQRYQENINNIENQLLVSPFIRSNDINPYIPGSSIKGSIRTAVLNYIINKEYESKGKNIESIVKRRLKNKKDKKNINRIAESEILKNYRKNAKEDPFRALSIEDIFIDNERTEKIFVGQIINRRIKNKNNLNRTWQLFCEVTASLISTPELSNSLKEEGKIRINDRLNERVNFGIKITMDYIAKSCNYFFKKIASGENNKFYKNETKCIKSLMSKINNTKDNQFIIRVGRFSHFESVSLENFDSFKKRNYGRSRNICENLFPLGWIRITYT